MRKFYIIYGVLVVALIVLKITGLVSWWVVTAPVWFPLGVFLSYSLAMAATNDIGNHLKNKERKKHPDSCDNCLFRKVQKMTEQEKCLGEEHDAEVINGKCPYYHRSE